MPERRRSERIKCRFDCQLVGAGKPVAGTVVDISSGGLAVRCEGKLQQGDSVTVQMTLPGRGKLDVEALVWHVRHGRRRDSGKPVQMLGMMLSKAPNEFLALVPRAKPDAGVVIEEKSDDDDGTHEASSASSVSLTPHRVRLRHRSTPRTRVVTVDATSIREACEIATQELGAEWAVLESLASAAK